MLVEFLDAMHPLIMICGSCALLHQLLFELFADRGDIAAAVM